MDLTTKVREEHEEKSDIRNSKFEMSILRVVRVLGGELTFFGWQSPKKTAGVYRPPFDQPEASGVNP